MSFQSHGQQQDPSLASVLYFLQKEHAKFDRDRGRYVGQVLRLTKIRSSKCLDSWYMAIISSQRSHSLHEDC